MHICALERAANREYQSMTLFNRRSNNILQRKTSTRTPARDLPTVHAAPRALSALAAGAVAVGSVALGAIAVGAVAIGALAIGRMAIGRVRIARLEIDELSVRRLVVTEQMQVPESETESGSAPRADSC
jgi:hypothetical protein